MSISYQYISIPKNSILWLSFFLFFIALPFLSFASGKDTVSNRYRAIHITTNKTVPYTEVSFSGSQRFYKLLKSTPHYRSYLCLLKWSVRNNKDIIITRRTEYSDTITNVKKYQGR